MNAVKNYDLDDSLKVFIGSCTYVNTCNVIISVTMIILM